MRSGFTLPHDEVRAVVRLLRTLRSDSRTTTMLDRCEHLRAFEGRMYRAQHRIDTQLRAVGDEER